MPFVTAHMSISLDGFCAGPDQSLENPLGIGGMRLHQWHFDPVDPESTSRTSTGCSAPRGAYIMGRNMYGPVRGEWGDRDVGGLVGRRSRRTTRRSSCSPTTRTTRSRRRAARPSTSSTASTPRWRRRPRSPATAVDIAGGASAVRQALQAGVLDELVLDIAPVVLGEGERIFDGVAPFELEPVEVTASPAATHVVYRMSRRSLL